MMATPDSLPIVRTFDAPLARPYRLTDEGDGAGEHASGWGVGFHRLAQMFA